MIYRCTSVDKGQMMRRYWRSNCEGCAIKPNCTTGKHRRVSRWEHEAVVEAVQARLDREPEPQCKGNTTVCHLMLAGLYVGKSPYMTA